MFRLDVPAGTYILSAVMRLSYLPGALGGRRVIGCALLSGTENRVMLGSVSVLMDESRTQDNVPLQGVVSLSQPDTLWVGCTAVGSVDQDQVRVYATSGNLTALTVDSLTMQ
jgi:hypothetical protein